MKKPKTIVAIILAILVLIILIQNTHIITLKIFFWTLSLRGIIFMPLLVIVGFIIGYIVAKIRKKRNQ